MSQHDYDIANQAGAAFRADLNLALAAVLNLNSGTSAPTTTVAGMLWYDTTNGIVKQRNAANSAWINRWTVAYSEGQFPDGSVSAPGIGFGADTNNGFYRVTTDSWAAAVAGAQAQLFNPAGEINLPLQPAFLGYLASNDNNVTGAGTDRSLQATTEVFDQNGDFNNSNSIFTAPVTGRYMLNFHVTVEDLSTAATVVNVKIVTSNRTYLLQSGLNPKAGGLITSQMLSVLADMDAADTAQCLVSIGGMAGDTADISGSGSYMFTYFSGHLAC
jgi:hypothetical protein